ncbi:MAG: hypothetical protein ACRDQ0_09400, partial [Pseudonocardia sp.]
TPTAGTPVWEGGQVHCQPTEQVRIVVNFRGVLHIQWSEEGRARHEEGPFYKALYGNVEVDTGAPNVSWRAEAKPDNDHVPGDIARAFAECGVRA